MSSRAASIERSELNFAAEYAEGDLRDALGAKLDSTTSTIAHLDIGVNQFLSVYYIPGEKGSEATIIRTPAWSEYPGRAMDKQRAAMIALATGAHVLSVAAPGGMDYDQRVGPQRFTREQKSQLVRRGRGIYGHKTSFEAVGAAMATAVMSPYALEELGLDSDFLDGQTKIGDGYSLGASILAGMGGLKPDVMLFREAADRGVATGFLKHGLNFLMHGADGNKSDMQTNVDHGLEVEDDHILRIPRRLPSLLMYASGIAGGSIGPDLALLRERREGDDLPRLIFAHGNGEVSTRNSNEFLAYEAAQNGFDVVRLELPGTSHSLCNALVDNAGSVKQAIAIAESM